MFFRADEHYALKFYSDHYFETSIFIIGMFDLKKKNFFVNLYLYFAFYILKEKSLPGVVMALVCNVFDMLYQLANLEEPR